jgi:hypothetical protein
MELTELNDIICVLAEKILPIELLSLLTVCKNLNIILSNYMNPYYWYKEFKHIYNVEIPFNPTDKWSRLQRRSYLFSWQYNAIKKNNNLLLNHACWDVNSAFGFSLYQNDMNIISFYIQICHDNSILTKMLSDLCMVQNSKHRSVIFSAITLLLDKIDTPINRDIIEKCLRNVYRIEFEEILYLFIQSRHFYYTLYLDMAIRIGCLKSFKKLLQSSHHSPDSNILYNVIISGTANMIQYVFSHEEYINIVDFELLKRVIEFGPRDSRNISLILEKLFSLVNPFARNYIIIEKVVDRYKHNELEYILNNTKPGNDLDYNKLLTIAVKNNGGHNKIVKILLKFGADASKNNNYILKMAINCNYVKIVKAILKYNIIVYDNSLLYRAVKNGCWKIIQLLLNSKYLEYNIKPNINSAIDLAKKFERNKAIQILESLYIKRWSSD